MPINRWVLCESDAILWICLSLLYLMRAAPLIFYPLLKNSKIDFCRKKDSLNFWTTLSWAVSERFLPWKRSTYCCWLKQNPYASIKDCNCRQAVAQLAERSLPVSEVLGSNPFFGKILMWTNLLLTVEKMKIKKKRREWTIKNKIVSVIEYCRLIVHKYVFSV